VNLRNLIKNIVTMERYAYTGDGKYPAPKRSTATETYPAAQRQPEIGKHTKNRKRRGKTAIRGTEKIPRYTDCRGAGAVT
jgi:hypothetical protein